MSNRIIPLIVISIVLLIVDWYIYCAFISTKTGWSERKRRNVTRIWWGYTAFLILGVFSGIFFNLTLTVRAIILVAFFITFVSKIFFLPFLVADDIRRVIIRLTRKSKENKTTQSRAVSPSGDKIPRSDFLIKAGIAVAAVPFASLSWGIISGAYDYRVRRRTLYLKNLPKAFEGIKLGQISDIHSGSFYNKKAVSGGVELLLAEKPDFVFFTGDLVNNMASEMRDYQDIFSKVKAPLGVFSTLGNHDYGDYHFGREPSPAKAKNLAQVIQTHKNMGWDILMKENRRLKVDGEEI